MNQIKQLNKYILGFLCLTLSMSVLAQGYPNKPVKIIVPFASGGPADSYARFMAQKLQDEFQQSFIVENKPGAGSVIGTDLAAKAPADGYSLLMMSNAQTVNESLTPNKPFNLTKDFVAVSPINYSDLILVVHPSLPVQNLKELIQLAKSKPDSLNFASSGNGTPYHMAGELFNAMAGVKITHIPYKGSSGARTDLIGGQVNMMFDAITSMNEFVKNNKVRAIATTGRTRSSATTMTSPAWRPRSPRPAMTWPASSQPPSSTTPSSTRPSPTSPTRAAPASFATRPAPC